MQTPLVNIDNNRRASDVLYELDSASPPRVIPIDFHYACTHSISAPVRQEETHL